LPPFIAETPAGSTDQSTVGGAVERQRIAAALSRTAWNVTAAARLLDISRSTLYRKIQEYALSREAG
jgi:transcriptional regulator of acetoin/glycerol metabolism